MFFQYIFSSWCSQIFQTSGDANLVAVDLMFLVLFCISFFAAMPCTSLPAVMMNLKCVSNSTRLFSEGLQKGHIFVWL